MPHRSHSRQSNERRSGTESVGHGWESGKDRRRARRVRLCAPLAVHWDHHPDVKRLRIIDLSRSGFQFECTRIYAIEERGHAESIKPEETRIDSDFVIVWSRDMGHGRHRYGARFVKSASHRRAA
jgi:hypothetical protein